MKTCAWAVAAAISLLLAASSAGQTFTASASNYNSLDAPSREPLITIHKDVTEVRLEFTVSDHAGRPVSNVSVSDLRLLDDGKPVTGVSEFRSESDLPLRLGLLVDTSSSVYEIFGREKQTALEFLQSVVRPQSDRLMIENFDTRVEIPQPFAFDPRMAGETLAKLHGSDGLTSFYDALYTAGEKMLEERDDRLTRRAILVISDGEDNYSMHSLRDAIEIAQQANAVVYAISIHAPFRRKHGHYSGDPYHRGDPIMKQLAEATGGHQYVISNEKQAREVFEEVEHELRGMYSLAFPSSAADGRFHPIQLVTTKDLTVHCRSGYWAVAR
jgi:Ca-activated chloride channel family protein